MRRKCLSLATLGDIETDWHYGHSKQIRKSTGLGIGGVIKVNKVSAVVTALLSGSIIGSANGILIRNPSNGAASRGVHVKTKCT